jgi:hypothetical protein
LEAVLADIKGRGTDYTINLGDCVTTPLWPRETIEALTIVGFADCARKP